ncbi:E3 ubiquitin-protein ligase RNF26-like [Myxocyprinus asiaticus]|uniref:E3 ubiquitin-protein ligase RNF26-like n=1 Tax=Myxocyprinus asiaticus TaxID=70543 RepID=UPI002221AB53|nr:E3 ubiquitin-protein ligase RNF26-like [Myxocyprinus asiaticus]
MGLLNFVFSSIGKCIDLICLLLDLNFVIVSSLIQLLVALISFVNSLPMLLTTSVLECWNLTLLCIITMRDGVTVVTHNMVGGWMQLLGGALESFKMIGYLSSHLVLRTKELMHRGLLSGHGLLRQAWEGCGIVFSLLLYFINTIINLLLIGTQNLYALLVSTVEAVSCPLQKAFELTLTVLTFLYSSLVGTSVLLWTPCRLAMEFMGSVCHIFVSVFLRNLYGLLLTLVIIAGTTIYLNPALPRQAAFNIANYINTVPILRRLRRTLHRLYMLERNVWQRLAWHRSRIGLWVVPARIEAGMVVDREVREPEPNPEQRAPQAGMAGEDQEVEDAPQGTQQVDDPLDLALPGSSTHRPLQKFPSEDGCKGLPTDNLLTLLQEQEARKKCVICQDSTKTVVLLPCRHLCLCRDCTNILLSQPIYQHNCPLCRHMILQTMDVYL